MDRRLPPRDGEWIDRSQRVEFRFEGRSYTGFAGDVLASALWASDVRLLGRSFKYHRPRGLYSLMNHDVNLLVEDGRRTNLRGDALPIVPGLDVRAVNTFGGVERDRLRIMDRFGRFLPVGFYYKAFHTPRRLFPFYENQMRKVAGLGRIDATAVTPPSAKDYAFCDLLVVGAGPAGLSAAIAAAERGVQVLVVEEQARPGGSLAWQHSSAAGLQSDAALSDLLRRASELGNLQIRCGTQSAGWYADHWIALVDDRRLTKLRAKAMLVATGCFEQPAVFQNNDLPGVMLGSAAQRLIRLYGVKPCDRAVVLAANSDGYRVALELFGAGVSVAAVVDLRVEGEPTELGRRVADVGIPIRNGRTVYEAVPARGKARLKGAVVCPLDEQGRPRTDAAERVDCDGIVMSVGWAPNGGLVYQAGGRFRYAAEVEQFVPKELPPGLYAAGRVNGVFDLEAQIVDGRRGGLAAAAFLGRFDGEIPAVPAHGGPPPSHPYPIFAHTGKKNFVDLDEDLHLADFVNAHQEGYDNIELMKRYTTVGMGPSQGKLSNMNAIRILARLNGASIDATGTTTSRPFHQPVPLGHLAGRRFHPLRRTSLDHWHETHNAEMIHAGAWLRPEYYKVSGQSRDACIFEEAKNVRENVGLIDVGTLGKLHINGAGAARFLEFIYTGRFEKQRPGTLRYGLACDESGVIIEDGVVARLAEDRFYVTATSSGAAAFYRELQRWALVFQGEGERGRGGGGEGETGRGGDRETGRQGDKEEEQRSTSRVTDTPPPSHAPSPVGSPLATHHLPLAIGHVTLINATGHLAAMNVAGPRSRELLQPLTDADLSPAAFPYLGVREASVAGVPATLLRVGFVGELGYEIHVPASAGLHVWNALLDAGGPLGIRPFGVEAQRLLRLEKGHIIVSQDTDALTDPYEASLEWAIGKDKPFFIGGRSLQVLKRKPATRRLVGLLFPAGYSGPLPEECHLIITNGEMTGRITSIAGKTTLGRPIALAFVRPNMTQPGTKVGIRLDDGRLVEAEVATIPFYDSENERQR